MKSTLMIQDVRLYARLYALRALRAGVLVGCGEGGYVGFVCFVLCWIGSVVLFG